MRTLAIVALLALAMSARAAPDWTTTDTTHVAAVPRYWYSQNVTSTVPGSIASLNRKGGVITMTWFVGEPKPTQAQLDAIDRTAAGAFVDNEDEVRIAESHGWSIPVRNNAASNIIALASVYGVTDQPISWADVATAIQSERADATASNDVMRLLNAVGDGTSMLSYKEFYAENGGDIRDVRQP